jgi:hypothetical protein
MSQVQEESSKQKHGCSYWLTVTGAVVTILTVIVACAWALLWAKTDNSQWIIAIFTVVMAGTTAVQCYIMFEQNRKFEQQNQAIVKQTDAMLVQNAAIESQLEQVQLEQRAWLVASINAGFTNLMTNEEWLTPDGPIIIRNTGATPAVIIHSYVLLEYPCRQQLDHIEYKARERTGERVCVGPDETVLFYLSDYGVVQSLAKSTCETIRDGGMAAYIMGGFIYQDAFGNERKTLCSFAFDSNHNRFSERMEDGEMT